MKDVKKEINDLIKMLEGLSNLTEIKDIMQYMSKNIDDLEKGKNIKEFKNGLDRKCAKSKKLTEISNIAWDEFAKSKTDYLIIISDNVKIGKTSKDWIVFYRPLKECYNIKNKSLIDTLELMDKDITAKKETGYSNDFMANVHELLFMTMLNEIEDINYNEKNLSLQIDEMIKDI